MKSFVLVVFFFVLFCAAHINAITNGYSAPASPHHVYIFSMLDNQVGIGGGGSLISSSHVLTVGNLIQNYIEWRCRLGNAMLFQTRQFISTVATIHPNYTATPIRQNDIGIITLPPNSILSFSVDIAPIALPPSYLLQNIPFENEQGSIIGFGATSPTASPAERLQRGHQRVIDSTRCSAFFGIDNVGFFCAEDPVSRSNICNQDIGGGFLVTLNGADTLMGISAMIIEACDGNWPSAYTRVHPYREWIRTVTSV